MDGAVYGIALNGAFVMSLKFNVWKSIPPTVS